LFADLLREKNTSKWLAYPTTNKTFDQFHHGWIVLSLFIHIHESSCVWNGGWTHADLTWHAGYPTAAAGAEEQGGRKGRRGKTTSRGEKGFIEGW
jgi:hypothetical protein